MAGSYAYVACYLSHSLTVVDVSSPTSPTFVTHFVDASQLRHVSAPASHAHAAARPWMLAPRSSAAGGRSSSPCVCLQASGVALLGNYAFVTLSYDAQLTVVDISIPASPAWLGSVPSPLNGTVRAPASRNLVGDSVFT